MSKTPRGVVAIFTNSLGAVVVTTCFEETPNAASQLEAQKANAFFALANKVVREFCTPTIYENMRPSIIEALFKEITRKDTQNVVTFETVGYND